MKTKYLYLFILSIIGIYSFGQENQLGTEKIDVKQNYRPKLPASERVFPELSEENVERVKLKQEYKFIETPAVTNFEPSKLRLIDPKVEGNNKQHPNWLKVGFGNQFSPLVDGLFQKRLKNSEQFGVGLNHISSWQSMKDFETKTTYNKSNVQGFYFKNIEKMQYQGSVNYKSHSFHYYGFPIDFDTLIDKTLLNTKQKYNVFSINNQLVPLEEESILEKLSLGGYYFKDNFNTSEFAFDLLANINVPFSKGQFGLDNNFDVVNSKNINSQYQYERRAFQFNISPNLKLNYDPLYIKLGVKFDYLNDSDTSNPNGFKIYPDIQIDYILVPEVLIAYGGLKSEREINSYNNFTELNQYIRPGSSLRSSEDVMNLFGGLKGKLSENVSYNVSGYIKRTNNFAQFIKDTSSFNGLITEIRLPNTNEFEVKYDTINQFGIKGELIFKYMEDFTLNLNGTYNQYSSKFIGEVYNLPKFKIGTSIKAQLFEKLAWNIVAQYIGDRQGENGNKLPSYLDLGTEFMYQHNEKLGLFLKGNNLLNNNYLRYQDYQMQGAILRFGVQFMF